MTDEEKECHCIANFSTLFAAEIVFLLLIIYVSCGVCRNRKPAKDRPVFLSHKLAREREKLSRQRQNGLLKQTSQEREVLDFSYIPADNLFERSLLQDNFTATPRGSRAFSKESPV